MPSPFPGMDPFLEAQGDWPSFHNLFVAYCAECLNAILPDSYVARIEQRVALVSMESATGFRPDVVVARGDHPAPPGEVQGGLATLVPVAVPLARLKDIEEPQSYLRIERLPNLELVAVLELLSPSNKFGSGRAEYLEKRDALIDQPVHLVEIDLLLSGERLPMRGSLPNGDSFAFVSRVPQRPFSDVFAWSIRHPLPILPIPLRDPDPDAQLDLARTLTMTFDRGRFGRTIRYERPLPENLPLSAEDRAWSRAVAEAAIGGS